MLESVGTLARTARRMPAFVAAGAFLGAMGSYLVWGVDLGFRFLLELNAYVWRSQVGWSTPQYRVMVDVLEDARNIFEGGSGSLLLGFALAVPIGMLVRVVARARTRAGLEDPLEAVRTWTLAHPQATRGILAAPAVLWLSYVVTGVFVSIRDWGGHDLFRQTVLYTAGMGATACVGAVFGAMLYGAMRFGLSLFLRPTMPTDDKPARADGDRVQFDAVAVTAETWAAVALMGALPILALLLIGALNLGTRGTEVGLALYVAVALLGTMAFRHASRIAVGVDGVYVTGTSRSRFFAYEGIDEARANGSELQLLRGTRVILRLQLHGEDAAERPAILARIQEAIAKAKTGETAAAGQIVASTSDAGLARLAEGAADYRAPALTREQLWSLVEGPEHGAKTRTAAARALAKTADAEEKTRLRVAAEHCAEPQVRVLLLGMAQAKDEDEEETASESDAAWLSGHPATGLRLRP
jgi:hypothetical protein